MGNNLQFRVKTESIRDFCNQDSRHRPIITLRGIEDDGDFFHAVVLDSFQSSSDPSVISLKVKNSLKGKTIFGQAQPSKHDVECKVTLKNNAWNLADETCYYIDIL